MAAGHNVPPRIDKDWRVFLSSVRFERSREAFFPEACFSTSLETNGEEIIFSNNS
ncbi:hypothetical protein [Sphingomonas alpina]|uniref:Uncharacterized protein n=1 Tax=Sphingomonas alpina TaxID=653931 RepID=A0A7H0LH49_9SPHN|nr:hypothetical protein [Sphingomonas alpina]QNQ09002.1 hypothetical protein H3Z74_20270 [Sphingomonas alpina]